MQIYRPNAAPEGVIVLQKIVGQGITRAAGKTPPADGVPGFATGCLFQDLNSTDGEFFLINEGTNTSADFNAIGFGYFGSLAATVDMINQTADVSARIVDCTAATLAVTQDNHNDKIITLNRAAGIAVTLPTAGAGPRFEFIIGTTFTGASSIKSATGADIMIGHASMGNNSDNSTVDWQSLASDTNDTIDLFTTGNTTGGFEGQRITIIGLDQNLWWVEIRGDAAGTEATPFQNTVA